VAAVAALSLAACAGRRDPAPVVDRGPGAKAPAAKAAAPAAAPGQAAGEDTYTVKRGDTLYSIALEHGADYRDVAQWNLIDDPSKLRVGQVLRVKPPESCVASASGIQVAPAPGSGRVESRPLEAPAARPGSASPQSNPVKAEAARIDPKSVEPKVAPVAPVAAEALDFIWPTKGKVLAGFAEPRSKGIDIDGKLGDPIVAAAAGRVTYIGTGIPGLGKLVVIKHDNGFITVYAHNREILVKEQQAVTRGQRIAELGASDSDRPKLHFQIRKGSSPVDPLKYLPAS